MTPTSMKVLNGNPGKRALPEGEPTPEAVLPLAPSRFKGVKRSKFTSIAKMLFGCKVLTVADTIALEQLVECVVSCEQAQKDVDDNGTTCMSGGKDPHLAVSPHYKILKAERERLLAMLREFGMTPSSRASIKIAEVPELDPLAEMLLKRAKKSGSN